MNTQSLIALAMLAAGSGYPKSVPKYSTGATSAKPHDPERMRKAQEKRDRKARRKLSP